MSNKSDVAKHFPRDIADHVLGVISDDGKGTRHLRGINKDGGSDMCFTVVTVPGFLFYAGDMGGFSFAVGSFGNPRDALACFSGTTDKYYLAQKLDAVDKGEGYKSFSSELFLDTLREYLKQKLDDGALNNKQMKEIEEDYIRYASTASYEEARDLGDDIAHNYGFEIDWCDWSECNELTYRYEWAVKAIAWAADHYFKQKESALGS